ncbi:MAG: helix-turn-helix domain-containing protein [Lachnospiraceae bacterium]|nr:helix-turn-helix domain-containing protein [Lachnospiraceae bacterium]
MKKKGIALKSTLGVTRLISAFYYEFPKDFNYSGERHLGWEFVYVDHGKVRVDADNATYILKKGELVCHKPHEFHNIRPFEYPASVIIVCFESSDEYMSYFNNKILSINQRQKQYLNDIADIGKIVFRPKDPLEIARDGQMDPSEGATPYKLQFAKNAIQLLLLSLMDTDTTEKQNRITEYEHASERKALARSIRESLSENLEESVTLAEISTNYSYSLSSIKRIFRDETGTSIIAFRNELRMNRAKELLKNSDLSIGHIAILLGYSNIYYFSLAFKKKWGMNPSTFRKSAL